MLLNENENWNPESTIIIHDINKESSLPLIQETYNINQADDLSELLFINVPDATSSNSNASIQSLNDTLSMSSGSISTSSSLNGQGNVLFSQFQIPWGKMPFDIMHLLQNKSCLGARINAFANIIVDELRKYSFYIPTAIF